MSATITTITTIEQVIRVNAAEEATPELTPFSILLEGASYAAVDNSGSTGSAPLRVAKSFVNAIGVSQTSLWNSRCNPPVATGSVNWRSTGGTSPHTIF